VISIERRSQKEGLYGEPASDLDIAISHDRLLRRKHGQVQRTEDSRDNNGVDGDAAFEGLTGA
jgi:hypothetical protein